MRRRDARRVARVTSGAADYLRNVLIPDGNGGDFHLDFLLLTSRGLVVIDMRDITGNVFGGPQPDDRLDTHDRRQPQHLHESADRTL